MKKSKKNIKKSHKNINLPGLLSQVDSLFAAGKFRLVVDLCRDAITANDPRKRSV